MRKAMVVVLSALCFAAFATSVDAATKHHAKKSCDQICMQKAGSRAGKHYEMCMDHCAH
jgi:hypothetical protein